VTGRAGDEADALTLDLGPAFRRPAAAPASGGGSARPDRARPGVIDEVVVNVDGGSRGNPGPAGIGAVVQAPDGTVLAEIAEGIGRATNNVAEYKAMIAALKRAGELGARRVTARADSKLVIEQLRGAWKVKHPDLKGLWAEARRLANGFDRVTWQHVPRERNRAADALANRAMDDQARTPRAGRG